MRETVEGRAVKIAARLMQGVGLCRYDSYDKCRRMACDENICTRCIAKWLLTKAGKELTAKYGK